jgi:hypothetical protein
MSKFKSNVIFKHLVVGLLTIYLFFALTNVLLIPHSTSAISNLSMHSGPIIRRQSIQPKGDAVSFNIITDKSIIDDDSLNSSKSIAIIVLFVLGGLILFNIKPKIIPPNPKIYYNLRYSFLFFCKLRI